MDTNDTTKSLIAEYGKWLTENNLPEMSADELYVQRVSDDSDEYIADDTQRIYLKNFIERWESASEREN